MIDGIQDHSVTRKNIHFSLLFYCQTRTSTYHEPFSHKREKSRARGRFTFFTGFIFIGFTLILLNVVYNFLPHNFFILFFCACCMRNNMKWSDSTQRNKNCAYYFVRKPILSIDPVFFLDWLTHDGYCDGTHTLQCYYYVWKNWGCKRDTARPVCKRASFIWKESRLFFGDRITFPLDCFVSEVHNRMRMYHSQWLPNNDHVTTTTIMFE